MGMWALPSGSKGEVGQKVNLMGGGEKVGDYQKTCPVRSRIREKISRKKFFKG